jgi:hypothetical protein
MSNFPASSPGDARRQACLAVRTLIFMEATGLRPSATTSKAYPRGVFGNAMPGGDHLSEWYHLVKKIYVLVDEPYGRAEDAISKERLDWADKFGWAIVRSTWAGMYKPGSCQLYLASDNKNGFHVRGLCSELDSLPPPITEAVWNGLSASCDPPFISPAAEAAAAIPQPAPKPLRAARR